MTPVPNDDSPGGRRRDPVTRDRIGQIAQVVQTLREPVEQLGPWQEDVDKWRVEFSAWARRIVRRVVIAGLVFGIGIGVAIGSALSLNAGRVSDINESRLGGLVTSCKDSGDLRGGIQAAALALGAPADVVPRILPTVVDCDLYARRRLAGSPRSYTEEARAQRRVFCAAATKPCPTP